jgi:TRAP-type C4-dicarboxylate transport system permease small subunit
MKIDQLNQKLQAWVYPMTKIVNTVAMVILFLMMVLTITDVFLRKVFSNSILGTVEVTEFMMLAVVFFGLAHTEVLNGHIKVDLFVGRLDRHVQGFVDAVTQFTCFMLAGLITWAAGAYAEEMRNSGEVSQDLWIPIYPFLYVVMIGCALFALVLLIKCFMAVKKMKGS